MTKEEKKALKSLSGQMLWLTSQTRPDLAFETCAMSNVGKNPTVKKIVQANKAVRKLKNKPDVCIHFVNIGPPEEAKVLVYGDGSHNSLSDGSSQGALIVFLCRKEHAVPILWQSKKLKRVTKSPLSTEIIAVGEAADAGILVATMVKNVYKLDQLPRVVLRTDSKSLLDMMNTTNTIEDMSMRVSVARLRQMVEEKELAVEWVSTEKQLADVMTKHTASATELRRVLETCQLGIDE